MISLALAIIFPVLSVLLFKVFTRYQVNNFQAIVFNYFVAFGICYALSLKGDLNLLDVFSKPWIFYSLGVGVLFIINFQLIALTTQKVNIATSTLANKMSLIIPVIGSFIFFQENLPLIKFAAIFLAFIAIYLIVTNKGKLVIKKEYWHLPLLIFFLTGIMEFVISYVQKELFTQNNEMELFTAITFLFSFCLGILVLFPNIKKVKVKNVLWGAALGVPNALGIYFLMQALASGIKVGIVFPIIHTGSLLFAVVAGYVIFKEKLTPLNWLGLALAFIAIFVLSSKLNF